jgi:hypothetical protein
MKGRRLGFLVIILACVLADPAIAAPPSQTPVACAVKPGFSPRVRTGPNSNYAYMMQLKGGDRVTADGRNPATTWLHVTAPGVNGWVETWYLKCDAKIGDLPPGPVAGAANSVVAKGPNKPPTYGNPGTYGASTNNASAFVWVTEYDTDRERSDYRQFALAAPVPELCQLACANDPGCWSYVYAEPGLRGERARCYLKGQAPAAVARAGFISGVKGKGGLEIGFDRVGGDYDDFGATSADDCFQRCIAEGRCWAASYDLNQQHCWLKEYAPPVTQDPAVVSALKTLAPWEKQKPVDWRPVAACTGALLYREDLQDGRAQGWQLQPGWRIDNPSGKRYALAGREHVWASLEGQSWGDAVYSAWVNLNRGTIHLSFRRSPGPTRYYLGFNESGLYLKEESNGQHQMLGEAWFRHSANAWHLVQVAARSGRIEVFVDGVAELEVTDSSPLGPGGFALETLEGAYVLVDDVQVCAP